MSDTDWTEGVEPPRPKKRRGPLFWILGCMGCGCLVVVVAVAFLGFAVVRGMDPDRQWPRIRSVLHFEERPEQPKVLIGWDLFGGEQYQLDHTELGLQGVLMPLDSQAEVDALFATDSPALAIATDLVEGTLAVQGREVRSLHYRNVFDSSQIPEWIASRIDLPDEQDLGAFLRIDLSTPGGRFLVFDLAGAPGSELGEADVQAFLEAFDVWHEP